MIIGIDGNEANVENKVGISEYAFELLCEFKKNKASEVQFQIYLKNAPRSEMPSESDNWHYRIVRPSKMWTQIGLPIDLYFHKPRPDVFFTPTHYAPRFSPIPTIMSVMDLSFIYFPELFKKSDLYQLMNWTRYSVKNAKKVFTISNASKDDIIKTYRVRPDKVIVTYPGIKTSISEENIKMKDLLEKYSVSQNYILFVGTLQPRKNITKLIEAFSRLQKKESFQKKATNLVIIGKKGWLYEDILSAPKRFGIEKEVIFLEFVDNEELVEFYKHAICFVLPSLYEGFGLPVLEAMKYGCPVITSNVSSLPEAGGDAALYVDPENVEDIAQKIEKLVVDEKLQKEMVEKGKAHVKKFNWQKTAQETLTVLEKFGATT